MGVMGRMLIWSRRLFYVCIAVVAILGLIALSIKISKYMDYRNARAATAGMPHRLDIDHCMLGVFCNRASRTNRIADHPTRAACEDEGRYEVQQTETILPSTIFSSYKVVCRYDGPELLKGLRLPDSLIYE